ncbi:MAG: DUF4214 domain-containing protein [Pikeienuella sp.]
MARYFVGALATADVVLEVLQKIDPAETPVFEPRIAPGIFGVAYVFSSGVSVAGNLTTNLPPTASFLNPLELADPDPSIGRVLIVPDFGPFELILDLQNFDGELEFQGTIDGFDVELLPQPEVLDIDAFIDEIDTLQAVFLGQPIQESLDGITIDFGQEPEPEAFLREAYDTATWDVPRAQITETVNADGSITVTSDYNDDGVTDTAVFTDLERFELQGGAYVYDLSDQADEIWRLYRAVLNRTPDELGLRFWDDVVSGGAPLSVITDAFIDSPEFLAAFGGMAPSAEAYIDALYNNVLGRDADPEGRSWWIDRFDEGVDRRVLVEAFADSPEFRELTAEDYDDGVWVDNSNFL